jgi:hypothetical protein
LRISTWGLTRSKTKADLESLEDSVKIDIVSQNPAVIQLVLSGEEINYLRMALERATFQDTPPQHQRAIYNFAEDLLRALEKTS